MILLGSIMVLLGLIHLGLAIYDAVKQQRDSIYIHVMGAFLGIPIGIACISLTF